MGKRKRENTESEDLDRIMRKIRKLEHKVRKRRKRRRETSSELSDSENLQPPDYGLQDNEDYQDEVCCEEVIHIDATAVAMAESVTTAPQQAPEQTTQPTTTPDEEELQSLEPEILQLLGEDHTNKKDCGENLHIDIVNRWSHILANGLPKDTQSELVKKYLPPENCPSMRVPKLNLEIKAALTEINIKKDLYSQNKQNQLASSLTAIGQTLNWTLSSKANVPQEVIKTLSDAGRLICDSHYRESQSRRFAILNTLNRNIRDTVKDTKIDDHLFGTGLSDHIKTSKAISKTGSDMKPVFRTLYKPPATTQSQSSTLNSRGVPPPQRAAAAEPRANPAPRRPPRDRRRQDAPRGRRSITYSRQAPQRRR